MQGGQKRKHTYGGINGTGIPTVIKWSYPKPDKIVNPDLAGRETVCLCICFNKSSELNSPCPPTSDGLFFFIFLFIHCS